MTEDVILADSEWRIRHVYRWGEVSKPKEELVKRIKELGTMILGIWLIVTGAVSLFDIYVANLSLVLDLLAIAAGALILMKR